jgi:four helix bundle protein
VVITVRGTQLSLDWGMNHQPIAKSFVALDLAYELVSALAPTVRQVARHDASLGKQLTRALASVPMNLAESGGRTGADRVHFYRIAYGSLREVSAALEVATRFGWLDSAPAADLRDRLGAMLWRLARR